MIYWLNICIVIFVLLLAGASMAVIYLLVPLLFAFAAVAYLCKFAFDIWIWQKLASDKRHNYKRPGHLMIRNQVMSVKIEWLIFWVGFFGFVLWINDAQPVIG